MTWIDSLKQRFARRQRASFPFFMPTPERDMDAAERSVVQRLLKDLPSNYQHQLDGLRVLGRCGCGVCPTIFFQVHRQGDQESDLVTAQGIDEGGGLVAAVLLEKNGTLSQLEFYSIDGHSPWFIPHAETLQPY